MTTHDYQRAKHLAAAAGCNTDEWRRSSDVYEWINDIATSAVRAVNDAAEHDSMDDPAEQMNNPHELVTDVDEQEVAWGIVYYLEAWRVADWDAVLTQGYYEEPEPDRPGVARQVPAWVLPGNPADLPARMLHHLGVRIAELAVADARAVWEARLADDDTEDEQ